MIKIKLTDGSVREYAKGTTAADITKDISMGLYRAALAAEMNTVTIDLTTPIEEDCNFKVLTFDDIAGKKAFWHTSAHVLAQAVKRLYPSAKLAIGPAIESGFYYDFDIDTQWGMDDLKKIEDEMKKIIKEKVVLQRFTMERAEAIAFMKKTDEPYKVELIEDLPQDAVLSFYKQGEDFTDLCAGPHLEDMSKIKAIKLLSVTGAYWRGSEKNKMLKRIYGITFPKAAMLEEHLERLEEAKKRDHNKIGRELEFFTTSDLIGQGLPIMLPKGARLMQVLQRFVEDEEQKRGWQLTKTPLMAKSDLYKLSGHWGHYKEGMFVLGDEEKDEEVFALRPMTCPFQYQVYLNRGRSYRDLPMRLNETSTLFRKEASGEMHGLIRVRQFTISEGHLMCMPEQLDDEFKKCVELAVFMLKTLGLYEDASYRFSLWDENDREKYIGTAEQWNEAQNSMRKILDHLEIPYVDAIGEAAFYGPKLDIQIKNVHGKEDTLITIQIDQMLAEKFGMEYVDRDGVKKNPYIIHRTSLGCYERTIALLLEKYAGALPTWMSPVQVKILPIADRHQEYAQQVQQELELKGIRVEVDNRSEKTGFKIREAQMEKIPYMLIVGDSESEKGEVSVRSRGKIENDVMSKEDFITAILDVVAKRI